MEPSDLDSLAPLYDLAFRSFDLQSREASEAKQQFYKLLEEHYEHDCPELRITRDDYRREVVKRCITWLRRNN